MCHALCQLMQVQLVSTFHEYFSPFYVFPRSTADAEIIPVPAIDPYMYTQRKSSAVIDRRQLSNGTLDVISLVTLGFT